MGQPSGERMFRASLSRSSKIDLGSEFLRLTFASDGTDPPLDPFIYRLLFHPRPPRHPREPDDRVADGITPREARLIVVVLEELAGVVPETSKTAKRKLGRAGP